MGKAEDLALEKYPQRSVLVVPARGGGYYADSHLREGFIEGYHQAEKDLELTWEQIYSILYFEREVLREFGNEDHSNEEVCKEVLKRFKEREK